MNSLVSSGHPLANVEQYPSNRRIRFRENRFDTRATLQDVLVKLKKELSDCDVDKEHYSQIVSNCSVLFNELSSERIRSDVRSLNDELRQLSIQLSDDDLLSKFISRCKSLRLSDEHVSLLVSSLESDGKIYGALFGVVAGRKLDKLFVNAYVVNRKRVVDVKRQLAFLNNSDEVSKRRLELEKKIVDAKAERSLVVERQRFLSSQLFQFESFTKVLFRIPSVDYIFSMFDEELFLRREITCFNNIDMRFVDRLLQDISDVAPNFSFDKYLTITSLSDDVEFMSAVKDCNDSRFTERYQSLFKDVRIVTFTQQFPCFLSNLLDLNILSDKIDELSRSGDSGDVFNFYVGLDRRIRLFIQFGTWLFQQDFSDTRSLAERQSAWVKDQLAKADRVEDAGGSVASLIGGSARHKNFRFDV